MVRLGEDEKGWTAIISQGGATSMAEVKLPRIRKKEQKWGNMSL